MCRPPNDNLCFMQVSGQRPDCADFSHAEQCRQSREEHPAVRGATHCGKKSRLESYITIHFACQVGYVLPSAVFIYFFRIFMHMNDLPNVILDPLDPLKFWI